jgi:hypothetical protein
LKGFFALGFHMSEGMMEKAFFSQDFFSFLYYIAGCWLVCQLGIGSALLSPDRRLLVIGSDSWSIPNSEKSSRIDRLSATLALCQLSQVLVDGMGSSCIASWTCNSDSGKVEEWHVHRSVAESVVQKYRVYVKTVIQFLFMSLCHSIIDIDQSFDNHEPFYWF